MIEKIRTLMAKVDALALRERGLLLFVVLFVLYMAWDSFLMVPVDIEQKQLRDAIAAKHKAIEMMNQQSEAVVRQSTSDPDRANRDEKATLEASIHRLDERLKEMTVNLVDPVNMVNVLKEVLKRQTDLQLVAIETLGAKPLLDAEKAPGPGVTGNSGVIGIFKHDLVITFSGGYLDILTYLEGLEKLPRGFYWKRVTLNTVNYPDILATLEVYTLSVNEGWIGI